MRYQAPTGSTDSNAGYIGKNPSLGQQGSRVPPKAIEQHQRELVHLIEFSGQSPSDADLQQVRKAIESMIAGTGDARSWRVVTGGPLTAPPGSPAEGEEYLVADSPTGAFAGQARKLARRLSSSWSFWPVAIGRVFRIGETTSYFQLGTGGWAAWDLGGLLDSRYLRKDVADAISTVGITTTFENLLVGPHTLAGFSRRIGFRQGGDAFESTTLYAVNGVLMRCVLDPATGTLVREPQRLEPGGLIETIGPTSAVRTSSRDTGGQFAELRNAAGLTVIADQAGERMRLSAAAQQINRAGTFRQIATENRLVSTGTGLTGGGDLSADRTLAVDTAWLSNQMAVRQVRGAHATAQAAIPLLGASAQPLTNVNGLDIATLSFTPLAADSILSIVANVMCGGGDSTNAADYRLVLFDGATRIAASHNASFGFGTSIALMWRLPAGSTTPRTFSLRAGYTTSTGFANATVASVNPSNSFGTSFTLSPSSGFTIFETRP